MCSLDSGTTSIYTLEICKVGCYSFPIGTVHHGLQAARMPDHIVTMHQTLHFFDTMLSHDHPAYLGVLRLAFEAAKIGNDKAIVRLYIVTLTFLPINIFCGVFGTNVKVPHNGTADDHSVNSDGTPAAYWWFGIVIVGVLIISGLMAFVVYWTFRQTRKAYKKRGAMTRL